MAEEADAEGRVDYGIEHKHNTIDGDRWRMVV